MLSRLKRTLAGLGPSATVLYLLARLIARISFGKVRLICYHITVQPLPTPSPGLRPSARTQVREINYGDPVIAAFPRPSAVLNSRFERGHRCLVAETNGRFSGFIWFATDHYDEDEVRCRFQLGSPESTVWDYDIFVVPAFRTGRTFLRLWSTAATLLEDAGIRASFSRISAFNPASLASHKRLGAKRLCSAGFICAGPLQIACFSIRPWLHIGFGSEQPARLQLDLPAPAHGSPQ